MSIKKPVNENYCATVTEIKTLVPLENCNNVVGAIIFGNQVIVGKDTNIGDKGIFFPVECELSKEFLSNNNLYRHSELNSDKTKKGYFEDSGRVKCIKFRNHKSEGIFLPLESLSFTNHKEELTENTSFDEISGIKICKKYVIRWQNTSGTSNKTGKVYKKKKSKIIDEQFRFHIQTAQLGKNMWKIKPTSFIQISRKIHGSSFVSSNILCKRKLNIFEWFLHKLGVRIETTEYSDVYSSRKVIKNADMDDKACGFYNEDIWGEVHKKLKDITPQGITLYGEVFGYLKSGGMIQKNYSYGCKEGENKFLIYRMTITNTKGQVFEINSMDVKKWAIANGLNPVDEYYYGEASKLFDLKLPTNDDELKTWQEQFLEKLKEKYLEKKCWDCVEDVWDEGIVVRVENGMNDLEVLKLKSFNFLEAETKSLDKGDINIEDNQE